MITRGLVMLLELEAMTSDFEWFKILENVAHIFKRVLTYVFKKND